MKLLGLAQVLGAVGVIVPAATGILPILTPLAALCLGILMGGAIKTHMDRNEPFAPPAVFLACALFVGVARFAFFSR